MSTVPPKVYIGIDPDVEASGFAVWDKVNLTALRCYDLPDLFDSLLLYHKSTAVFIRLEAGWLAKGLNWHKGGNGAANKVGRNHEIGRQIEKFCIKHNIPYKLILPAGYTSYTHESFCNITKWPIKVKTNSETRVAAMMVYGC